MFQHHSHAGPSTCTVPAGVKATLSSCTMPILEKNTTSGTTLYAPVYNVHMGLHVALVVTILSASNTYQKQKTPSAKLQTVVSLVLS